MLQLAAHPAIQRLRATPQQPSAGGETTPLPGRTRRMDQFGEGCLDPGELRDRSAAHLPPPTPTSAGKTQPRQGTRRTVRLAAAMARRQPRQRADAGRAHLGAVNPRSCLENAGRLPTVTAMPAHNRYPDHRSAGQPYPPRIGFRSRARGNHSRSRKRGDHSGDLVHDLSELPRAGGDPVGRIAPPGSPTRPVSSASDPHPLPGAPAGCPHLPP